MIGKLRSENLLEFDLGASRFQLGLDIIGLVLGRAFFDRLRRSINEILRFFQAEARKSAQFFDDVDLVGARGRKDYVECRLLFDGSRACGPCSSTCSGGRTPPCCKLIPTTSIPTL